MKSIINKVLIIAGLISLVPFLSYAATPTLTCSPSYPNDLVGKMVTVSANVQNGNGNSYNYSWGGDDGFDDNNQTAYHVYSHEGTMTITVTASSTDSSDYLTNTCSVKIYSDATLPDYSASCEPSTDRAVFGQTITWNPTITGPLAPYSIVWTGTDGLNSTSYNPSLTYASSGDKLATMVSFQSRYGVQTPVHNAKLSNVACKYPTYIIPEEIHNPTPLVVTGTCSASASSIYVGSAVSWNSNIIISGGAAPYRITWTDNDGTVGTGSSTLKTYSTTGTKNAFLTVDDNAGQFSDIHCGSVTVNSLPVSGGGHTSLQTCNSFTYSAWSACSNNSQLRYVLTSSPSNCVGGAPVVTQNCSATSTATSTNSNGSNNSTSTPETATSTNPISTSTPVIVGGNGNTNSRSSTGNTGSNNTGTGESNAGDYIVSDSFEFNQDQNQGARNEDVANLQNRLVELGYLNKPITGLFGPATRDALIQYQNANGLKSTGMLDADTRGSLNKINTAAISTITENNNVKGTVSTSTVATGTLVASALAAVGSITDFTGVSWPNTLYIILVLISIALIFRLFMIIKKSDEL